MPYAGRDDNLPGPECSDIHGVLRAEGRGLWPQIDQGDLKHALNGNPEIGLFQMIVKRLDAAGIAERGRDLRGCRIELAGGTLADSNHFEEIAAVIGPHRVW